MIIMLKKNIKIAIQNASLNIIGMVVFYCCFFAVAINGAKEIMTISSASLIGLVGSYYLGASAVIISNLVFVILNRVERENNVNQVLLADGVSSFEIVISRFLATVIISYVMLAVQFAFMCIYCKISTGETVQVNFNLLLKCFAFSLVAMSLNGVAILLLLISRKAYLVVIAVEYLSAAFMLILGIKEMSGEITINILTAVIIIAICLLVNIGVFFISRLIPNELIVNADTK